MPKHHDEHISPYNTVQLFELVADIEKYHEFLPWVVASRIIEKSEDVIIAELVVRFKIFTERYTSRVELKRPKTEKDSGEIKVVMVEGPFHHLDNYWKFEPAKKGGTKISFGVDFAFKSKILDKMIGPMFGKAVEKMSASFEKRADELYSKNY